VIRAIAAVTGRALVARRRFTLLLVLALLPVGIGLLARIAADADDAEVWTLRTVELLVVRAVLPLVALILGTTALGAELEDGTAIHLLTRPVARWRIVAGKLLAAAPIAIGLGAGSALLTGVVIGGESGTLPITLALTVGVAVGALLYTLAFLALSVLTSRALIAGLVYVILWEGVLAGLFEGTQVLSIREYVLSIAGALDPSGRVAREALLDPAAAVVATVAVLVAAWLVATWRLSRLELAGGDAG
jgi:ABC-2 type transport system permease protein